MSMRNHLVSLFYFNLGNNETICVSEGVLSKLDVFLDRGMIFVSCLMFLLECKYLLSEKAPF